VTEVCTLARPSCADLASEQRRDMLDWLESMGVPGRGTRVVAVELLTVDCPMVAVTRIVMDENGHAQPDPADPHRIWLASTDHLVTAPPPAWWQPVS
jgi:hypothetical protein